MTLVELVVYAAIVSVVSTAIVAALSLVTRTTPTGQARLGIDAELARVSDALTEDVLGGPSGNNLGSYAGGALTVVNGQTLVLNQIQWIGAVTATRTVTYQVELSGTTPRLARYDKTSAGVDTRLLATGLKSISDVVFSAASLSSTLASDVNSYRSVLTVAITSTIGSETKSDTLVFQPRPSRVTPGPTRTPQPWSPTNLAANPIGHNVQLSWSPGSNLNSYRVLGAANGISSSCNGASWGQIGSTTVLTMLDVSRWQPEGTYYCYQVQSVLGSAVSTGNPITAAQLGFVANSVQMVNAGDTSACGGLGSETFGQAGALDCGDQIVVTFNQPVSSTTGPLPLGSGCTGACGNMPMFSGSYSGNGVDNRSITGLGFRPDVVIIKNSASDDTIIRTSTMVGDVSKTMVGANAFQTNRIQSFDPDGFTVGKDPDVNASGKTYYWVAFKATNGEMIVGSYTGSGVDGRTVTGFGFQPDYVIVLSAAAQEAVHRTSAMSGDTTLTFENNSPATNRIQALLADGMELGNDDRVNKSATAYYYVAWKAVAGRISVGSYVGNNSSSRAITGLGFAPEWLLIKDAAGDNAVHKSSATRRDTDTTQFFSKASNVTNRITSLDDDGFTLGSDVDVNGSGKTYYWVAFAYQPPTFAPPIGDTICAGTTLMLGAHRSTGRCGPMATLSGSYTGNGIDNRAITGLGFRPDVVIVKDTANDDTVIRTSAMVGDVAKPMVGGKRPQNNTVQSLDDDGFTLGTSSDVNASGKTYHWVAFLAAEDEMKVGAYVGTGAASQAVTGIGFQPDYLIVFSGSDKEAVHRSSTMSAGTSVNFNNNNPSTSWITSLDTDGFTVGGDDRVSKNATTYFYVAWKAVSGKVAVGAYTGNGLDNRAITGVGFSPEWLLIKNAAGDAAVHKPASSGKSTDSTHFFAGSNDVSNRIQAIGSDGFTVGSDNDVNNENRIYHWVAFNLLPPATSEPTALGELAGGSISSCVCRFKAAYIWSANNTKLTITISSRLFGAGFPTLSASAWTLYPTTDSAQMLSQSGGHHICTSNIGEGNCLPGTSQLP